MKTESHSIHDVLAKNSTSFFIPPFQRAYAWGKPEIERFFTDLNRVIDSELDHEQPNKLEHFFGTLVIKEEKGGFANKSVIVDGQQRLTTSLILLIALRDSGIKENEKKLIHQNYLTNSFSTYQDKIKLKQVTKDWESYRALVNGQEAKPGVMKLAYDLFRSFIRNKRKLNSKVQTEDYITAFGRMNVAVIFLDERPFKGEDPQIIFETLNSLGKPLSLSDLVRNFVLLKLNSEDQSEIYEDIWHPKIEDVFKNNTSKFFRDYLQYKKATSLKVVSDNNTKLLYQQFKDYVNDRFDEHTDFINDIIRYVKCYKWIISETYSDYISNDSYHDGVIKELLRNIFHDIKSEAFKPFVLGLLEYHQYKVDGTQMSDEVLIDALQAIRTYLIRRRVMSLTQGENKEIVTLSRKIPDIAKRNLHIMDLFKNMFYKLRLPNDSEIKNHLELANFYKGANKYVKFILGKIEENSTKVAIDFRNKKVTIEHIMPQELNSKWRNELGENFEEIHQNYLHNIGNLILTEFNSEMGNKSFEYKKKKLKNSSLSYRLNIINQEQWNKSSILRHQRKMINSFLNTFSLPEEMRENDNWNSKLVENSNFSPLDIDAGEKAEGNKPIQMKIGNNVFEVKTWQKVFIQFLNYVKDSKEYDFDFIVNNQSNLFNREETILKWYALKEILDKNNSHSSRYKNFDGEIWSRSKNLHDDMLFIHINISASTTMSRIANIMENLAMPPAFVNIKLR